MTSRPDRSARCLARAAWVPLLLAPRAFRSGFQRELLHAFAMALSAERRESGALAMMRFWLTGLADALRSAVRERVGRGSGRSRGPFGGVGGDVRHVVTTWRRAPGLPTAIVVTMALGLALSSAIFAFADGYLFRPLPFPDGDRLFFVRVPDAAIAGTTTAAEAEALRGTAVARFGLVEWGVRSRAPVGGFFLDGDRQLELTVHGISPGFAETIQIPLAFGRYFEPADYVSTRPIPIWLSHRAWQRDFGGDKRVLGRTFRMTGFPADGEVRIVGVMAREVTAFDLNNPPPDAVGPEPAPEGPPRPNQLAFPIVRLPQGLSIEAAEAELSAALQSVSPAADPDASRTVRLRSLYDYQVAGGRPTAMVFLSGAILVLGLVAVSVVHLQLARSASREPEVALRSALGASRWRIARLFLVESLMFGLAGTIVGLAAGALLASVIASAVPVYPSGARNLALVSMAFDGRAMLFAVVLGAAIAAVSGLWAAVRSARVSRWLTSRTSGTGARLGTRASRALVASEVAVASLIMVGAAFMTAGIWSYLNQPLGYEIDGRFSVGFQGQSSAVAEPDTVAVLSAARATPGVAAVAFQTGARATDIRVDAAPGLSDEQVTARAIEPDYFGAWGVRPEEGRLFTAEDVAAGRPVAVVESNFAALAWPEASAVGQTVRVGDGAPREVIGVIPPMRWQLSRAGQPAAYMPRELDVELRRLVVHAPGLSTDDVQGRLRASLLALTPDHLVTVYAMTFENQFLRDTGEARFQRPIAATFGIFAFAVAASGLFGLVSYLVAQRTRDFAIQLALGARPTHVWRAVARESLLPAGVGLAVGLAVAAALERVVRSSVFGWDASVPLAMVVVTSGVVLVAVLAAIGPARRAMRVDPATALRSD